MQESISNKTAYKIRFKSDQADNGLASWSPLRQLNTWARSSDTFTLRAFLMAFGWKPFLFAAPRPHVFLTLDDAAQALEQIVYESSLLAEYSVSPHLTLSDLFVMAVKDSHEVSGDLRASILSELEICDIPMSHHDFQIASLSDENARSEWYVVYHGDEGHLFLVGNEDSVSWVPEHDREQCWTSQDQLAALNMAKLVTRREGYYAYPLKFPKPENKLY
jgi:hypothetical protein